MSVPWYSDVARWTVYVVTLPFWLVATVVLLAAVALRALVVFAVVGWTLGEGFADWVFRVEK